MNKLALAVVIAVIAVAVIGSFIPGEGPIRPPAPPSPWPKIYDPEPVDLPSPMPTRTVTITKPPLDIKI